MKLNRREFLAGMGTATIAAGVSNALTSDAAEPTLPAPTSDRKIRIGVVGGNFGCAFYWQEHPNCQVAAVSDLRPDRRDRLSKTYHCDRQHESLEKLILDEEVEAVAVFTPAPDHVRHCVAALKAGKHVLCAVPAAMTLEECARLRDTVKQTGLTFM